MEYKQLDMLLNSKIKDISQLVNTNVEKIKMSIESAGRLNQVFHIPGLKISNYKKKDPNEQGVFEQDVQYPVLFVTMEEVDPKFVNDQIQRGYDCAAFVIDKRGRVVIVSLFACTIHYGE